MIDNPTLPLSNALDEASPDSIQDLFARDPEGYQQQDLPTVVNHFRALRERLDTAEGAPVRHARTKKTPPPIPADPSSIGL